MRFNRGTVVLLVVSVIVIAAMVLLSNQPASAPGDGTPTATPSAGPIFPEISDSANQANLVRLEVNNTADSSKVVMNKDDAGVWTVSEATNTQQLATDQNKALTSVSSFASLVAADKFETDKLADFGLDKPTYTITLTDKDGKTYSVKIGNKAVANQRYYALVNDDTKTVYVLPKDAVDALTLLILQPDYVASATPTATMTATANPYSEVEQTATQDAFQQQVYATMTANAEATFGATPEATGESTAEATTETTPEATTSP